MHIFGGEGGWGREGGGAESRGLFRHFFMVLIVPGLPPSWRVFVIGLLKV